MTTWLPDFLARTKARRIEVRVPVSSIHSIGWLRKLGMEIEARLPGYSVVGEDFFQLAFTTPKRDLEDVLSPSPRSPSSDQGAHEDSCRHSA
jgi:ribosomal protein S18 acetylase RimI-like enzyme